MKSLLFVSTLLIGAIILQIAYGDESPSGKKVLVVLDNMRTKSTHSAYFSFLQERFTVDFVGAEDRNIKFKRYGEWMYDHLLLFAPSASEVTGISSDDVLEFIDAGRNVIIAADSDLGDLIREIATECNVEFDEEGTRVIDHFSYDTTSDTGDHTHIVSDQVAKDAPNVVQVSGPLLFRGIAQDIEEDSELLFSLATGTSTSYSANNNNKVKDVSIAGKKISLVTALQARNNARVVFAGSLDMFSDRFFRATVQRPTDTKSERVSNEEFAKQITRWTLQEKGVLRAKNAKTNRVGESVAPFAYTIKQEVEYSIEIEEWKGDKWVPFVANDVQLEYRMLDPYVRTTLKNDGKGKFFTSFVLPDVYGVFTFKVEYNRKGTSNINSIIRIPVRPFRHNEYERFIDSAYPYYASAFSMMAGLFVFSWFFLYHKETKQ